MTQAAKFFDPVLGIDIHMVVIPPSPAPVPMPHPFIGVVFDPIGAAIGAAVSVVLGGGGLVLINSLPIANTGTNVLGVPHIPMGASFHACDIPGNDGALVTGSKTVAMGGSSMGRLGSLVTTCNFPINLPTSICLAVPMGNPVLVGGPDSFDPLAAVSASEVADPRPWAELIRQWSTFHPEFAYLPRKYKIAVSGGPDDGAGVRIHDQGFQLVKNDAGELGFRAWAGGGLGRTPILGLVVREFLPWQHLLTYSEAILRVYNRYGRRDNPFKARIKILVKALGIAEFTRQVEEEWSHLKDGPETLTEAEVARVSAHFTAPAYAALPAHDAQYAIARRDDPAFAQWAEHNVHAHKVAGYAAVTLSLKAPGQAPGDATSEQMEFVADLADRFGFGEVRVTQAQNLILPDVRQSDLYLLWTQAGGAGLVTPTVGLVSDITCCPGGDFCDLANARSIPVANAIQARFDTLAVQEDIGRLKLNISGCMNACGHHHVGHIGILGVDKNDKEFYQVTLGGAWGVEASLGKVIGPSFSAADVPGAVERIVEHYRSQRQGGERFIDTLRRIGIDGFKARAYENVKAEAEEKEAVNG